MQNDKPIWTFERTTELSIEKVEDILFAIRTGEYKSENLPLILKGMTDCKITKEREQFTITFKDGHKAFIFIDTTNRKITIQGEWWYKGIYTLLQKKIRQ